MEQEVDMKVAIEYGVTIIVGVVFQSQWKWYVSDTAYWFLDYVKWREAYQRPSVSADR